MLVVHTDDDDTSSEISTIIRSFPGVSLAPLAPVNAARRPPLVSPDELVVTVGEDPDPVRKLSESLPFSTDIVANTYTADNLFKVVGSSANYPSKQQRQVSSKLSKLQQAK